MCTLLYIMELGVDEEVRGDAKYSSLGKSFDRCLKDGNRGNRGVGRGAGVGDCPRYESVCFVSPLPIKSSGESNIMCRKLRLIFCYHSLTLPLHP
jgi:hypothetical protein